MTNESEQLREEQTRLEEQLAKVRQAIAAITDEEAAIVGAAVLVEARADPAFRAKLHGILDKQVKMQRHRKLLGLDDGERGDHRRTGD